MRHVTIRKKLLRYLEGELPDTEFRKIRAHLADCRRCQDDMKVIESLWQTAQFAHISAPSSSLWARISTQLGKEEKRGFFLTMQNGMRPFIRPAMMVALLLLILLGGIELGSRFTPSYNDREESFGPAAMDTFGLNYFEVLPPGSIDARILE